MVNELVIQLQKPQNNDSFGSDLMEISDDDLPF